MLAARVLQQQTQTLPEKKNPEPALEPDRHPPSMEQLNSSDSHESSEDDVDLLLREAREANDRLKKKSELERLLQENEILQTGGRLPKQPLMLNASAQHAFPLPTTINPEKLAEYWGRSLREHSDWTQSAENAFELAPATFPDDRTKVLFAAQFLRGDPRQSWFTHTKSTGNASSTWPLFVEFLLDLIEDPANRTLSVFTRYHRAKQQAKQSAHTFHTMLNALEAQLPEMPPLILALNFLVRLRDELHEAISEQTPLPQTRDAMVALATRIENARKHRLSAPTDRPPPKENKRRRFRSPTLRKHSPDREPYAAPRNRNASGYQGPSRFKSKGSRTQTATRMLAVRFTASATHAPSLRASWLPSHFFLTHRGF